MKSSLFLLLVLCFFKTVYAQQTPPIDNSLLLDYYQGQRYMDAYNYLKTAYPEPVTEVKALSNLAYTARMAGKLADAEHYYLRVYDKDSTMIATLFSLGGINASRGNSAKAIIYYKKILLRDSTNFNVYQQLANLSQNLLDTANYSRYLEKANAINPLEPDVAFELDKYYVIKKKYDKAAAVLDKAIAADTSNLILLKGRGEVYFLQKKYPETIIVSTKLIQAGNAQADVINWLAISNYKLRRYQECIKAYQMLSPLLQNEGVFFYLAMSYKYLKDLPNAITYFQKAITDGISANVYDYYSEIGDCYDTQHKIKKSLAFYQKSLQFKEDGMTYYSLGNIYDAELKDKKSAIKYYKKFLATKPDEKENKTYIDYTNSRIAALGN